MPEFPIVIHEEHNTYVSGADAWFGYKVSYVNYGIVQLSIHKMDARSVISPRLRARAEITRTVGLTRIWVSPLESDDFPTIISNFSDGDRWIDSYAVLVGDGQAWNRTRDAIKEFLFDAEWLTNGDPLDLCPIDGVPTELHDTHGSCLSCDQTGPLSWLHNTVVVVDEEGGTDRLCICRNCVNGGTGFDDAEMTFMCSACDRRVDEGMEGEEESLCPTCFQNSFICEECSLWIHYDNGWRDEDGDMYLCNVCHDNENNPTRFIMSWNYRPELVFHPMIPVNPLKPLYVGMELEVSWPAWSEKALPWLTKMKDKYDDILYAKSDSSVIQGFEVVTHPMSPDWATVEFPFDFFQEAIDLGARATHESCGTHIHIDKGALSTAQMWKLMQVHFKLREFCGTVGGRGTGSSYANWDNTDSIKNNLKEIARLKGEGYGSAQRYVPINVQNEQTIELRYMRGGIKPEEIRKNLEWVQALYEFTDYISVEDVKNGVIDSPGYLLGWIMDDDRFGNLTKHLKKNLMIPAKMPVRST